MTRESNMWRAVKDELEAQDPTVDAIRVENRVENGTPDVNLCAGSREAWIELKVAKKPARAATCLRVPHYTDEQRHWHVRRYKSGGRVFVLCQIDGEREYLLLTGHVAAVLLGFVDYNQLIKACLAHGSLAHVIREFYRYL